jgi:thioredoxin 1
MKTSPIVVALALSLMNGSIPALAATVQPYEQSAFDTAQKHRDPILVFVEASWCPTCASERSVLSGFYKMPEFKNLRVFDVDFDTSKPLLRRLHVQMQSTLIVYHGTRETGRMTGATNPAVILRLLETSSS